MIPLNINTQEIAADYKILLEDLRRRAIAAYHTDDKEKVKIVIDSIRRDETILSDMMIILKNIHFEEHDALTSIDMSLSITKHKLVDMRLSYVLDISKIVSKLRVSIRLNQIKYGVRDISAEIDIYITRQLMDSSYRLLLIPLNPVVMTTIPKLVKNKILFENFSKGLLDTDEMDKLLFIRHPDRV